MTDSTIASPSRRGVPLWAQIAIWVVLVGLLVLVAITLKRSQQGSVQPGDKIKDFSMPLFSGYELNGKSQVESRDIARQGRHDQLLGVMVQALRAGSG